jgi:hypothetical protein
MILSVFKLMQATAEFIKLQLIHSSLIPSSEIYSLFQHAQALMLSTPS